MGIKLTGEYWIDESGQLTFADGDVGDSNHDRIALESAIQKVSDHFGLDDDEIEADGFSDILEAYLNEELPDWNENFKSAREAAWHLIETQSGGISNLTLMTACGETADARSVAIKEWGWISVQKNQIVMWENNPDKLAKLHEALGEAFFEDGVELKEEDEKEVDLNIFIASEQKTLLISMAELIEVDKPRSEDHMLEAHGKNAGNTILTIDKENLHPAYKRKLGD